MSQGSSSSSSFEIRVPVGQSSERTVLPRELAQRVDVEPVDVVDAARDVGDGDHGRATVSQLVRSDTADVAESLDDAALLREFQPSRSHARAVTITTPAPVASCRKTEPPIEIGFPVTISGTAWPTCIE